MPRHFVSIISFTSILTLAFILRIYQIHTVPPSLFCDEAATGYNAYTLLHTGRDEYGVFLPAFFRSFDNFRPGFPMYFTVPFVAVFGLSEFSIRAASAVIGTLTVAAIFFLTKEFCSSQKAGALTMLFLAISPWHIQFSRYSEGNIYLPFFLTLGLLLFFLAKRKKSTVLFSLCFASFAIGFYTYFPAYFLFPLLLVGLSIIYRKELLKLKMHVILGMVVFTVILIPFFLGVNNGEILARFYQISSAAHDKTISEVIAKMLTTYVDHFTPTFLFTEGDIGYPTHFITRFSVKGLGELYFFQLPFIIFGLIFFFRLKKVFFLLLVLLSLYPLGSTLAPFTDGGGPFATRSILGVIPFQVLTGAGVVFFFNAIKKKFAKSVMIILFAILISISCMFYVTKYFNEYPLYSADFWGWQYGPKPILNYFLENHKNYDELIIVGNFNAPDIFIQFYDPRNICKSKCKFGTLSEYNPSKKQLFAVDIGLIKNIQKGTTLDRQKVIYYPNSHPAFYIGTINRE